MNLSLSPLVGYRWLWLLLGVVALAVCLSAVLTGDSSVLLSYLLAFIFWWEISLGCLALAMLHYLVGGRWGEMLHPFALAGISTLPLMLVLAIPLAAQLPAIYVWSQSELVAADPLLQAKSSYLSPTFFLIRGGCYFAIWLLLGVCLLRWSRPDLDRLSPAARRLRRLSAGGLILLSLSGSGAAIDWIMSLEPNWYSTLFPALIVLGSLVAAYLMLVGILSLLAGYELLQAVATPDVLIDLGNLMLAFLMLWVYFFFSQYLIIWSGNLPDEARWFLVRRTGGWGVLIVLVLFFHFVAPFLLLLSRDRKRSRQFLAFIALSVLAAHYLYLYWTILPAHRPARFSLHWADLVAPLGIGGLWLWVFSWNLARRLPPSLEYLVVRQAGGAQGGPAHA